MWPNLKKIWNLLKAHFLLLLIITVAIIIAFQNIKPSTYYSGWDNIHAEFDLIGYSKQVFFGSWVEHLGLGGPAAQAQTTEIFRLPIIFFFKIILPDNLLRYSYIFSYYLIGGLGMYVYLTKYWIKFKKDNLQKWLASLGAIFYMLHILTLQQFYIAFEMFMTQFAFLPFLLISIHKLNKSFKTKYLLFFIFIQILIAPSGHTSTVFYLAGIFSIIYAFFLKLNKGFIKSLVFSIVIGLLTFVSNAYWILPNFYYSLHNSHYVAESRDNQLFAPESIWSVREAATIPNFLRGTQYLFTWKDYSFENQEFEYIFNEWQDHLSKPLVNYSLQAFGIITVLGFLILIFKKNKKNKRFAILIIYLLSASFIWMGLLPSPNIFDTLYQNEAFREAFRNPFTKLSIIYSFASVLLFISSVELISRLLNKIKISKPIIMMGIGIIIYTAWPSFTGHFLSEKLRIEYPQVYFEMFDFLKTRDKNARILQLPQFSHAGWEYYDWQFLGKGNGYQGMGFYFFGIPQSVLIRDADRWVETSDVFYHQLKYALDTEDQSHFNALANKYNIDILIVDESKIDPGKNKFHNYSVDQDFAQNANFKKVWQKDFLTVYERSESDTNLILIPNNLSFIDTSRERIRTDFAYLNYGNYIWSDGIETQIFYPFANLTEKEIDDIEFKEDSIKISNNIPKGEYILNVPGIKDKEYLSPAKITYEDQLVSVKFPKIKIAWQDNELNLPKMEDFEFEVSKEESFNEIILLFNDEGVIIKPNSVAYPVLKFKTGNSIELKYAAKPKNLSINQDGDILDPELKLNNINILETNWQEFQEDKIIKINDESQLNIIVEFPLIKIDLLQNPSVNCSQAQIGNINTYEKDAEMFYEADNYGINCNGYNFDYISASYSYLLNIIGKNIQGRANKFFINYANEEVVFEDYLFQEPKFNKTITLHDVESEAGAKFHLNWETRSLGKKSINAIKSVNIIPLALNQLAQIRLEKPESQKIKNNLLVNKEKSLFDSIYIIDFECKSDNCYIGLDQSYDDLWLATSTQKLKLLKHYRLNNWANLWEVTNEGKIVIFYLPELISLSFFIIPFASIIGFSLYLFKRRRVRLKRKAKTKRLKDKLLGK